MTVSPTPQEAEIAGVADTDLIYEALRFYFWAAGQGISPDADQDCLEPEEGFWQYSLRTGDEEWETVADRFRAHLQRTQGESRAKETPDAE